MTYRGEVKDGVIVLEQGAQLAEGTLVSVEPVPSNPFADEDQLMKIPGMAVDTGIPDLARNANHYLYGHPKVDDE